MTKIPLVKKVLPVLTYKLVCLAFVLSLSCTCIAAPPIVVENIQRAEPVSFEKEILPILQKNCLACHSAGEKLGDLILESPESILKGGDTGAAVVAGKGNESLLLKMAAHELEPVMPPEGNDVAASNLTSAELGLIKLWIDQGARGLGGIESLSPKKMQALPKGLVAVQAVTLTPDGQYVAFGRSNRILLHHVASGQLVTQLQDPALIGLDGAAHRDLVQSIAFNIDGDMLASGGFREVKLWRRPGDVQKLNIAVGAPADAFAVSSDKKWIATNGPNHTIQLFSTTDGSRGLTLTGHTDRVTSIRFAMDGQRLVSGSADKSVRLWNLQDGSSMASLETSAPITAIEIVPLEAPTIERTSSNEWLVTGHSDNKLRVWPMLIPTAVEENPPEQLDNEPGDGEPGQPLITPIREIAGHGAAITSLASMPQTPRQILSGSMDSTIRRWNLENGQQMQQYNHGGPVVAITVASDDQRIASAGENRTAKLFNINGQQIAEMRGDLRRRIALTRAQQQETAANTRLTVAKQQADSAEKDLPLKTVAEMKLNDMLTAANTDVQTKKAIVDTTFTEKTATEKSAIEASTAAKTAVAERQVAEQQAREAAAIMTNIQSRLTRLQQSANGDPLNEDFKNRMMATQTELNAATQKSAQAATAVEAPTTKATEMSNQANEAAKKLETVQKPYNDAVATLKQAEANQNLLSQQQAIAAKELAAATDLIPLRKEAVARTEIQLAEAKAATETANRLLQESDLAIRSVAFSPDGSTLATAGDFASVHTWDARTGAAVGAFAGHSAEVRGVVFLDDRTIVSASNDQTVRIWEASPEWVLERTIGNVDDPALIAHRVTSVDFSADGSQLLVAGGVPSRRGELHVFNVADGTRTMFLPQAHDDVVYAARFSPDGKRIASGGADKYLRTFDIASSEQLRRFEGHTSYVLGVSWKRDGSRIASSGADNSIKIWDAETGDQQRTIGNFGRHVTSVHYIGETDNIISSCGDRIVRMHNAGNGGVIRNFSGSATWIHTAAITFDSSVTAAGDAGGNVYLWNGNTGQSLKMLAP